MSNGKNTIEEGMSKGFLSGLIALKLVCCGGLILLATGSLAGLGAWFSGFSIAAAVGLVLAVFAILLLWRQIASRQDSERYKAWPIRARPGEDGS